MICFISILKYKWLEAICWYFRMQHMYISHFDLENMITRNQLKNYPQTNIYIQAQFSKKQMIDFVEREHFWENLYTQYILIYVLLFWHVPSIWIYTTFFATYFTLKNYTYSSVLIFISYERYPGCDENCFSDNFF